MTSLGKTNLLLENDNDIINIDEVNGANEEIKIDLDDGIEF